MKNLKLSKEVALVRNKWRRLEVLRRIVMIVGVSGTGSPRL